MVDFDIFAGLAGGFVATLAMTAMMTVARQVGVTAMPPIPLVMGSMFSGDRRRAMGIGVMAHYVAMGTVVFGLGYASLFTALDDDSWRVGAMIGLAHGVVVGLMFMPMMPSMHRRMTTPGLARAAGTTGAVGTDDYGQVEITEPGLLGINWGTVTPVGLIMGHSVYGLVLALVYGALA